MFVNETRDLEQTERDYGKRIKRTMGIILDILVKNNFFILLNKFNLHTIIYVLSSHLSGHM